ncbi:MAG: DedA family protein [Alphaproteobacteria bacterium]|nr:DedA family protein [Alphaproteobacteria bacterium]
MAGAGSLKTRVIFGIALAVIVGAVVTGIIFIVGELNAGMTVPELLRSYGYWLILGWTLLEGETIVIIAGVAAAAGHMELWLIILVAWVGSYISDQIYFTIGKKYGPFLLKRFPWAQRPVDRASRLLLKYDIWFILSFRFIYGVRNVTPPALAIAGVSHKRFAILNFIAAGLWANSFAFAGYLFGQAFKELVENAHMYFGYVILFMFALAVFWAFYHTIRGVLNRMRAHRAERKATNAAQGERAGRAAKPRPTKHPAEESGP